MSCIADREDLPRVPIRIPPVHEPSSEGVIDLVVVFANRCAAVWQASVFDSTKDGIELFFRDRETVVLLGNRLCPLVEIEGEGRADVDR